MTDDAIRSEAINLARKNLQSIPKLTLADILDFAPVMTLPIRDARLILAAFKTRHNLSDDDIKSVCRIVQALRLY
jgi:L-cysteine desulfidase